MHLLTNSYLKLSIFEKKKEDFKFVRLKSPDVEDQGLGYETLRAINKMTTTLPLFWDLSSASKKNRIDASVKLVGALEQFQARFVPQTPAPGTPDSDDEEDEDGGAPESNELNLLNAQDVSYSIRRLIRGLASPRESSRLGFAVALTEVGYHVKNRDDLNSLSLSSFCRALTQSHAPKS